MEVLGGGGVWNIIIVRRVVMYMFLMVQYCSNGVLGLQFRAMYVFVDSLVDDGNNNFLDSIAKSNYYPYGCDFPIGPTGRFSNGKTFVDFLDPTTTGPRIVGGVNYASAAAGILDETGQHYGYRYSLSQQVINFENTLSQLRTMMSGTNLTQYLTTSLAVMVFGSDDYINYYLLPALYPSTVTYTPSAFANLLLNHYARQIQALYNVGLRKFFITGIGPLGCIPNQLAIGQALLGRCVDYVNQILGSFNEGLRSLVTIFNNGTTHPDAIFVYGNTYGIFGDILNNPAAYVFFLSSNMEGMGTTITVLVGIGIRKKSIKG
ncbi:GDSL esterase/lipase [Camellia lanceoleosa]|uniref:GDSL esterase/lipase n=1 Tax=Camellia lanceoleosa TaxID=1840588 RepID=A0ACC0I6B8_9ERIC|nr:GDSL esterase/lipase [Camellia lanceoleosa]